MELKIEHLKKSFDNKEVLKDITFTFKPGKIYGLLGRNGAGKTTLFNCLNQDITVDQGRFVLCEGLQEKSIEMEVIPFIWMDKKLQFRTYKIRYLKIWKL